MTDVFVYNPISQQYNELGMKLITKKHKGIMATDEFLYLILQNGNGMQLNSRGSTKVTGKSKDKVTGNLPNQILGECIHRGDQIYFACSGQSNLYYLDLGPRKVKTIRKVFY